MCMYILAALAILQSSTTLPPSKRDFLAPHLDPAGGSPLFCILLVQHQAKFDLAIKRRIDLGHKESYGEFCMISSFLYIPLHKKLYTQHSAKLASYSGSVVVCQHNVHAWRQDLNTNREEAPLVAYLSIVIAHQVKMNIFVQT